MNELDKQGIEYEKVYSNVIGGIIWVHMLHGKEERPANIVISRFLADLGKTIWLLPISSVPDTINPDAQIDNELWEFKTNHAATGNSIDRAIRDAYKQAPNVLIHLTVPMVISTLENAIYGRVRKCDSLSKLSILLEHQLFTFTKEQVISQRFRGIIKGKGSPA